MMLIVDIKKQLGNFNLDVTLELPGQGVTAIFGLSGSGKTSLIQLISGLIKPDEGKIILNNKILSCSEKNIFLPPHKRKIGYVFQEARLFPHYSVKGNLLFGACPENRKNFHQIVNLLGIEDLLNRYPNSLSGGEKQRVAIGRALLTNPDLLLMDEPLSALDLPRKQELLDYLDKLANEIQIPILYVTHSLDELVRLADKMVLIEKGKVKLFSPLEETWQSDALTPWQKQQDKGRSTLLTLPVESHHHQDHIALSLGSQKLWINATLMNKNITSVRLRIFSQDVSICLEKPQKSSIRNRLNGKVVAFQEQENGLIDVGVLVEKQLIWATITQWAKAELQLQKGQSVFLQIKTAAVVA